MTALLSVENLRKRFRNVTAVDGISFEVREGSCFGLLGPNGAGKTTTIEMLEGITEPSDGIIRFRGAPRDPEYAKNIGIQFQHTALQDFLSVRETLELFSRFYQRTVPLSELVRLCALDDFLDRDTRKLSGGQRQRLLLAIAMVNDPELLFLDEPTTGLDPQARRNFWQLIRDIKAHGKTIILTTHYMDEAQQLCDDIVIMDHGRIIAQDAPERLLKDHFDGALIRLPFAGETLPALPFPVEYHNGRIEFVSRDIDASLRDLMKADLPLTGLHIHNPNLDDLFLKLTGHALRA